MFRRWVHVASFDRLVLDVVTQDLDKCLQILCCPCGEAQNSGCCDGSDLGFGCLGGVGGGSFLDGIGMKWTSAIVGVGFGAGAVLRTVVVAWLYCDEPELIAVIWSLNMFWVVEDRHISSTGLNSAAGADAVESVGLDGCALMVLVVCPGGCL